MKSTGTRSQGSSGLFVLLGVALPIAIATEGCSRQKSVEFLGFKNRVNCKEFANAAMPLVSKYRELAGQSDLSEMLGNGRTFLTVGELEDSCFRSTDKDAKTEERTLAMATQSGTTLDVQVFYGCEVGDKPGCFQVDGYRVSLKEWVTGSGMFARDTKFHSVLDGKHLWADPERSTERKRVVAELRQKATAALGPPLVSVKCSSSDSEPSPFWRLGDYLVSSGCSGEIIEVRHTLKFISGSRAVGGTALKDIPEIDKLIKALRDDGVSGL